MNQTTEELNSYQATVGIVPMSIRMIGLAIPEGTLIYYDKINISVLSIVGRFVDIKTKQNESRLLIKITDDSGILSAEYIVQDHKSEPIFDISKKDKSYYQFIVNAKIKNDAPQYIIEHYSTASLDQWMYHTMKIIQTEVQSRPEIDWQALKQQPLEQQIEGYIRHCKRVNISALLKRFKCSILTLKLLIDDLKNRSVIVECLNKETYKLAN